MSTATMPDIACPECEGKLVEPRGIVVATQPYERPPAPPALEPRFTKIIEHKYACQECGHEFSIVEEF
jgi:DNA-directed RNA polymerase subunit RPC12/RpoP